MGNIPAPPVLDSKEFEKRYRECLKRGIKNPTIWDVDPEFKKWYEGEQRFYQFAFPVLGIASIVFIISIAFYFLNQ